MSHLRLCIDEDESNNSFVQFTESGSFSLGDFFKANSDGYMLKEIKNKKKSSDSTASSIQLSTTESDQSLGSTTTSASSTPSIQSQLAKPSNLDIPANELQRRVVVSPRDVPILLTSLSSLVITGPLGQGASGLVSKATHTDSGAIIAVKSIPLDLNETKSNRILIELKTLHSSTCPYITSFYGCFYRERALTLCLEYMDQGSLSDFLKKQLASKPVPENILSIISLQLLRGLDYLHSKRRLIHRDIKPSNILLSKAGVAKLSDFGVSGELGDEINKHSFVGTISFMAPERIQSKAHSFDSDLWSLGLTVAECALGYFPYLPPIKNNSSQTNSSPSLMAALPPASPSAGLYNATQTHIVTPLRQPLPSPTSPAIHSLNNYNNSNVSNMGNNHGTNSLQLPSSSPANRRRSFTGFWDILETIVKSPPPSLAGENYHNIQFSSEIQDFVRCCCQKEPSERSTAAQLLQHPFILKHNPKSLGENWQDPNYNPNSKALSVWIKRELAEAKARQEAEAAATLFKEPLSCQTPSSTTSSALSYKLDSTTSVDSNNNANNNIFHRAQRFTYNVFKQNPMDISANNPASANHTANSASTTEPKQATPLSGQKRKISVDTHLDSDIGETLDSANTHKTTVSTPLSTSSNASLLKRQRSTPNSSRSAVLNGLDARGRISPSIFPHSAVSPFPFTIPHTPASTLNSFNNFTFNSPLQPPLLNIAENDPPPICVTITPANHKDSSLAAD
jgi:serine/threonine protein kinase